VEIEKKPRKLHYFEGFLYYFERRQGGKKVGRQGLDACKSIWQNGNLASFHSIKEFEFLVSNQKEASRLNHGYIGGVRSANNSKIWTWTDGTPLNMTLINSLWYKGEPNNHLGNENIIELVVIKGKGYLNDDNILRYGSYICKIPCA